MRNTTWTPVVSILGSALLVSSCASDVTAPNNGTASEAPSAETEAAEAEPVDDEVQDEGAASPDHSDLEFTIDHAPEGEHGLEVSVSFNLQGGMEGDEGNVARAASHAVSEHPDYDLIIVRGYSDSTVLAEGAQMIDAWFKPENIEKIDLDHPDQADVYEHCYSCFDLGQNHHS